MATDPRRTSGSGRTSATPTGTLAGGVRALAALPGARLRGVSRLYATAPVGVDRPARVPERGRRARRAGRRRIPRPAPSRCSSRSSSSSGRSAAEERERWGPRELDLDLLVFGRARIAVDRPAGGAARTTRQGRPAARRPASARRRSGSSSSPRSPTSRRGSCRPAGPRPSRRRAARRERAEGPDAVRPIAPLGRRCAWGRSRRRQAPRKRVGRRVSTAPPPSTRLDALRRRRRSCDETTSMSSDPAEDERRAVVDGVAAGQRPVGDQPVVERPPLRLAVVVRDEAPVEDPEPVVERPERRAERVGRAATRTSRSPPADIPAHHDARPSTPRRRARSSAVLSARSRAGSPCCRRST